MSYAYLIVYAHIVYVHGPTCPHVNTYTCVYYMMWRCQYVRVLLLLFLFFYFFVYFFKVFFLSNFLIIFLSTVFSSCLHAYIDQLYVNIIGCYIRSRNPRYRRLYLYTSRPIQMLSEQAILKLVPNHQMIYCHQHQVTNTH